MKENISNLIMMLMFNALVICTIIFKRDGGTAIDFKTTNGIVLVILLALMVIIDIFYIVKMIINKKQGNK